MGWEGNGCHLSGWGVSWPFLVLMPLATVYSVNLCLVLQRLLL